MIVSVMYVYQKYENWKIHQIWIYTACECWNWDRNSVFTESTNSFTEKDWKAIMTKLIFIFTSTSSLSLHNDRTYTIMNPFKAKKKKAHKPGKYILYIRLCSLHLLDSFPPWMKLAEGINPLKMRIFCLHAMQMKMQLKVTHKCNLLYWVINWLM